MSGNILNFDVRKLELRLSDSEYYDYYLAKDAKCEPYNSSISSNTDSNGCLVVHYDFDNPKIYSGDTIYSLVYWTGATNTGYTLDTIGLTGIDNGLITFDKKDGDYNNEALYSALTESVLIIEEDEYRLALTRVTGMTGDIEYPMSIVNDPMVGDVLNLCGGFYQGFYKIEGTTYEVLPNRVNKSWTMEFWLKKSDDVCSATTSGSTGVTLNDIYPENKGIFFYWGTRAENKFWNVFEGLNSGSTCTSGSTEWCTPVKEDEVFIKDDESGFLIPLDPPEVKITKIENEFLIYGRAAKPKNFNDDIIFIDNNSDDCNCGVCNSCKKKMDTLGTYNVCSYTGGGIYVTSIKSKVVDDRNPFLLYGRAAKPCISGSTSGGCSNCGCSMSGCKKKTDDLGTYTVCNYCGNEEPITELDWAADVVDNAIAFMIKDDGSIGYRLLTYTATCLDDGTYVSGCSIEEQFSCSGCIKDNEWTNISIRFVANDTLEGCDLLTKDPRKGRLMFYVNCRLKFYVDDFDEFVARKLETHWKKQVGVPFNISLGGGTQGLLESMTFDGQDPDDMNLCVQESFAGTFIGQISQFRFDICGKNWCQLKANCESECGRYNTCYNCVKKNTCGCN